MRTTALRLYGANDVRLETFSLPDIGDDEILVKVISDSICMSSYKAIHQGAAHKRVPDDIRDNPPALGHEFCAQVVEVGRRRRGMIEPGQLVALQPALRETYDAAGYSFPYLGGCMTYGIIPSIYIEQGNVLPYDGDACFHASLAEPLSCVVGAVHACYHTRHGEYYHDMDIRRGGKVAVLAGAGPMGLALIDYLIHRDRKPSLIVVTDTDADRLARAARLLTTEDAAANDVALAYVNPSEHNSVGGMDGVCAYLRGISGGTGFDEAFVFAPVAEVAEQADAILARDGCMNFFAGPADAAFSARLNYYNVHYNATHVVGTSGGNTDDMREALELAAKGRVNPALLVTHIGGLPAAREATLNLPNIPGGKKLIYTHTDIPLTAISEFGIKGETDPLFAELSRFCPNGLWTTEAERHLLANAPKGDIE